VIINWIFQCVRVVRTEIYSFRLICVSGNVSVYLCYHFGLAYILRRVTRLQGSLCSSLPVFKFSRSDSQGASNSLPELEHVLFLNTKMTKHVSSKLEEYKFADFACVLWAFQSVQISIFQTCPEDSSSFMQIVFNDDGMVIDKSEILAYPCCLRSCWQVIGVFEFPWKLQYSGKTIRGRSKTFFQGSNVFSRHPRPTAVQIILKYSVFVLTTLCSHHCNLRLTYFYFAREVVAELGHVLYRTQAHFWHILHFWHTHMTGTAKVSPTSVTGYRFFSASGC